MKNLIIALTRKNRKDLVKKIKKVIGKREYLALPDTPAKIASLRQFLQETFARKLKGNPINRLKGIFMSTELGSTLNDLKMRFENRLILKEDYDLEVYWTITNALQKLITEYENEPGAFDEQLDTVSLRGISQSNT